MTKLGVPVCSVALLCSYAWAQESAQAPPPPSDQPKTEQHKGPGAAKDIGGGAGDIGTGAAKGAGDAAKGVGKGAVDLVTLHPVDAAAAVGKGAVSTGKDVTVGTVKGSGKIARGVGKVFKKIF